MHNENVILSLVLCSPLSAPNNGDIDCSSNNYLPGVTCTVTCDDNAMLMGNGTRICKSNGTWNGTDAMCLHISEYIHISAMFKA